MDNLERIKKQIKNLKQNKDLTNEELEVKVKEQITKQEILASLAFCIDDKEREFASDLLHKYLSESSLESTAEKDTLRQLIDIEVLLERIKKFLNTEYVKANPAIPVQLLDQLTSLNNQVIELKDKLGLTKKEEQKNVLEEWNKLKTKALNYYKESAGCNVVRCPECKKLFMILKNMKDCIETKLPWFKRTLLYNKKLFELYDQKRLSLEEMATIFGVSNDYIIYIYENEYKNDKTE